MKLLPPTPLLHSQELELTRISLSCSAKQSLSNSPITSRLLNEMARFLRGLHNTVDLSLLETLSSLGFREMGLLVLLLPD